MFFAEKIRNINPSDRVLEIGPGADPHPRSDVFLEKKYDSLKEYHSQLGHEGNLDTKKKVVYYDGEKFPFHDKEFDYVICSHVLEHVENIPFFLSEIFRVASKGYFEYPLVYYDYLYNFDVHINFLKFNNGTLFYQKKSKSPLHHFSPIQALFVESLHQGHVKIIDDLIELLMEGFEWDKPFEIKETDDIKDVAWREFQVPAPKLIQGEWQPSSMQLLKLLIKRVIKKIKIF